MLELFCQTSRGEFSRASAGSMVSNPAGEPPGPGQGSGIWISGSSERLDEWRPSHLAPSLQQPAVLLRALQTL